MTERRRFSGWRMAAVGSACYGLGISPMYYSWGFFLPETRLEIAMTDTQAGAVFSVWSYVYHLLGPLVGIALARLGFRSVMGFGSAVGVLAFWLMSRADSYADLVFAYGILGGIAIGFATILPAQYLAAQWFIRQRARATAFIMSGGAIVGYFVNRDFGPWVVQTVTWRDGWLIIAGISAFAGLLAVCFLRGRPENIGQTPDGDPPGSGTEATEEASEWTPGAAMRTPQFYLLVAISIAYGSPWQIVSVHGRVHLEALGFGVAAAGAILGVRVAVSLLGRISGLLGDFVSPVRLLAVVLLLEGIGCIGFIRAETPLLAYASVTLIGIGFGSAYIGVPVTFCSFYGRKAFGTTVGVRFAITGLIAPAAPTIAGMLSDWSGSFALPFSVMGVGCFLGAAVAFWLPKPKLRTGPAAAAATA